VDDCLICAKHRGHGPLKGHLVVRTDGLAVYHRVDEDGSGPLGYLFLEPERHVPYVADLTDQEAMALGVLRARLSRGLLEATGAKFVFAMVIGTGVAHVHEHVFARHAGAPDDLPWYRSHEASPRADESQITELGRKLRTHLAQSN